MALLLRRGLEADRLSFTPDEGELIYVTDTKLVYIGDGVTPGGNLLAGGSQPATPSYTLSRSSSTVNEGGTVTITLTTTNVDDGTTVPYTITGTEVTAEDLGLGSLTGMFTVNNGTATLTLDIAEDVTIEESETFTLTLNNISPTKSVSVTINDTPVEDVDGGGPTTPSFTSIVDGGSPLTSSFDTVVDGGTV